MNPRLLELLHCPNCGASIALSGAELLTCTGCAHRFPVEHGVPVMLPENATAAVNNAFDYLAHYSKDAEAFDYFEERTGATAHDERRLRENLLSRVPSNTKSILDVGCGSAWLAEALHKR